MSESRADGDFVAVAQQLYAVALPDFIAERTARAKAARSSGDRDLAARIAALPKPSAAAWLANLLAREGADDVQRILETGAALREAQQGPDRELLRELGAERRTLLTEVTATTAERAATSGRRASASVLEELHQTLQAALADEAAASALLTGRLVRSLKADGLEAVDLTDAVAAPGAGDRPAARRTVARTKAASAAHPGDRESADRTAAERAAAEQHAAEAEDQARAARTRAGEAADAARQAATRVEQREQAVADLEAESAALRERAAAAEDDLRAARDAAAGADTAAADAARDADEARITADAAAAKLHDPKR